MLTRPSQKSKTIFSCYPISGASSPLSSSANLSSQIIKKKSLKDKRPKKEALHRQTTMPLPQVVTPTFQKRPERIVNARPSIYFSYIKEEVQRQYYDERATTIGSIQLQKKVLLKPARLQQTLQNNFLNQSSASSKVQILNQFIEQEDLRGTNRSQQTHSACFFQDIDSEDEQSMEIPNIIKIRSSSSSSQHSSLRDIPHFGTGSRVQVAISESQANVTKIQKLESTPTTTHNSMISCETPPSKDIQKCSENYSGFPSPQQGGLFMKGRRTETLMTHMTSKEDLDETDHSIILDNCDSMMTKLRRQQQCTTPRR